MSSLDQDFEDYTDRCIADLSTLQEEFMKLYEIESYEHWYYDHAMGAFFPPLLVLSQEVFGRFKKSGGHVLFPPWGGEGWGLSNYPENRLTLSNMVLKPLPPFHRLPRPSPGREF